MSHLSLLLLELQLAAGAYEGRNHNDDHASLRREYVQAKLRFRRFFHMALEGSKP